MARLAERRLRLLLATAATLAVTVVGCVFAVAQGYDKGWRLIVISVMANLASSTIAFIFVSLTMGPATDDEDQSLAVKTIVDPLLEAIRSIPSREYAGDLGDKLDEIRAAIRALQGATVLEDVDWESLINGASEIDFVVQGWDGWFESNERALRLFIERGGKFRLYIYDPYSPQSAPARALMGERLGKTPHGVESEITGTISAVEALRDGHALQQQVAGDVQIYRTANTNWYFAARFIGAVTSRSSRNRDTIVFSIYSHTRQRPYTMPALTLDPGIHPGMSTWFEAELTHLRR